MVYRLRKCSVFCRLIRRRLLGVAWFRRTFTLRTHITREVSLEITGYRLDKRGSMPGGVFAITSRSVLMPTQLLIQCIRPKCEADHLPLSCAEVKNPWNFTYTATYLFMVWCLGTRNAFLFTLLKGNLKLYFSISSRRLKLHLFNLF
jgi:hypothetical protein